MHGTVFTAQNEQQERERDSDSEQQVVKFAPER